ncbi:hypothetical protein VTI74DRAFT_10711 [Chaetomium olivicolor]
MAFPELKVFSKNSLTERCAKRKGSRTRQPTGTGRGGRRRMPPPRKLKSFCPEAHAACSRSGFHSRTLRLSRASAVFV